ncbi:hypothetical protein [Flavobacterium hungaricum]|nr:hypothetical protein [Flavobacterium hungaricum]
METSIRDTKSGLKDTSKIQRQNSASRGKTNNPKAAYIRRAGH